MAPARPAAGRARVGRRALAATTFIAAVVGVGVWGAVAPDGGPSLRTVRVAAVQGGGVRGLSKSQVDPAVVYAAQFAATAQIPAHDGGRPPTLVVWPEDVVSLDTPLDGSQAEKDLSSLAVRVHATLEVGVTETVPGRRFRNEVVAFSPSGALVGRFEKVHRVPFGEYIPYRGFFKHLADLSAVPLDAVPGHGDGVLHTPAGPLGTMVSYEVFYADRGRTTTRAGAQLLTDPTNTSSYLTSQVPTQEIAAARLQAIAEGRDLVQAAPTGFSAFVDHRGRVLARTTLADRAVIVADLAMRDGRTYYERAGDLPVLALAGLSLVGGWAAALGAEPERSRAARGERAARLRRRGRSAIGG
jgi:apolipoprotein N-acyltransferase